MLFEFCKQHPDISVDIRYLSEAEIISGVAEGQLHLGIASQAPSNEMVRSYKLLDEHIHLVTSASNPDLQRNPNPKFAGYKLQDRLLLSFFKQYPKLFPQGSPELAIAVNSHQAMIEAVIHLGLYAALPHHSLSAHYNSGKIRQASNCEMTNKVFLIMPDSEFPERRSLEVVKFLKLKFKSAQGERG
jgi:DNA-binding transcriptional LysR family regulator